MQRLDKKRYAVPKYEANPHSVIHTRPHLHTLTYAPQAPGKTWSPTSHRATWWEGPEQLSAYRTSRTSSHAYPDALGVTSFGSSNPSPDLFWPPRLGAEATMDRVRVFVGENPKHSPNEVSLASLPPWRGIRSGDVYPLP